jgi:hypothetical protein
VYVEYAFGGGNKRREKGENTGMREPEGYGRGERNEKTIDSGQSSMTGGT